MTRATFIREDRGKRYYRCQNCQKTFSIDPRDWWQNAFYCSEGCAAEKNRCSGCGNNRHFSCTCNDD